MQGSLYGVDREMRPRRAKSGDAAQSVMHLLAEAGHLLVLPRPLPETCDEILKLTEKAVRGSRHILLLQMKEGEDPVQVAGRFGGGGADRPLALSRATHNDADDFLFFAPEGAKNKKNQVSKKPVALCGPRNMIRLSIVAKKG